MARTISASSDEVDDRPLGPIAIVFLGLGDEPAVAAV
jgi:hypothetical protein